MDIVTNRSGKPLALEPRARWCTYHAGAGVRDGRFQLAVTRHVPLLEPEGVASVTK